MLIAVLLLLLAVGAMAFAMSMEASLATLGARSSSGAAAARPLAGAAIAAATAEVLAVASGGAPVPIGQFGPWEEFGEGASAHLSVEQGSDPPTYRLVATAVVGNARADATAVFALEPDFRLLERRGP